MGKVVTNADFWAGKKVFLTGHTGFKGGWLAIWLHKLGAEVHGFSLNPSTTPSFFDSAEVAKVLAADTRGDICDYKTLEAAMKKADPDVIFHLAAQPLVRASYSKPLETLNTNIMGTAHLLEAARKLSGLKAILVVTTDKCYENREWIYPYRESDSLGGHDPYSASKACAEIVAASYRASYFGKESAVSVATARTGNVIGGGDWAEDRLLPDCIRAFRDGRNVNIRYPEAIRPWQHVLDPLAGYIMLVEMLDGAAAHDFSGGWNFGPNASGDFTVGDIAQQVAMLWGSGRIDVSSSNDQAHEAGQLRLDVTKARTHLGWYPRWSIERALKETVAWYKAWHTDESMLDYSHGQISAYESTL